MIRVSVCSECGEAYNWDDADENPTVCGECNLPEEDMIGIVELDFNEWSED